MVVYTCPRCQKQFNQKCVFDKHINRKIPCLVKNIEDINIDDVNIDENVINIDDFYCSICDRHFSRSDALKKHMTSQMHMAYQMRKKTKKAQINNNIKTNAGVINQVIGDKNIIINENYYLLSFGQEEIDKLTTKEKFLIFFSDDNPIIMIIVKTNLNPLRTEYHNVGVTNSKKSGYGIIYNGKAWVRKDIDSILNDLLNSKKADLFKIYAEIKEFLSEGDTKIIENKLYDIGNTITPKLDHHVKFKRKLASNLTTLFYNDRSLVLDAIKKSGKPIIDNTKENDLRCDQYDFDDIDKKMKLKQNMQKNMQRIILKREIAKDLLRQIDGDMIDDDHELLIILIDQTTDLDVIDVIMRLIDKAYCFGYEINNKIVEKQIKKDARMDKILFN